MEIKNDLISSQIGIAPKLSLTEQPSEASPVSAEFVSSKASLAARAYAAPQVNFGKNVGEMVMQEIISNKNPNQIKLRFNEIRTFLVDYLNFTFKGFHGSHAKFSKEGLLRPIIIADHDSTVRPEVIKDIRKYMATNKTGVNLAY
jgi:hypothetical protein